MHLSGYIAQLFWLDTELASDVHLDGCVCVVDAKYGPELLTADTEDADFARRQLAVADRVLINKIDLVDEAAVKSLTDVVTYVLSCLVLSCTLPPSCPLSVA